MFIIKNGLTSGFVKSKMVSMSSPELSTVKTHLSTKNTGLLVSKKVLEWGISNLFKVFGGIRFSSHHYILLLGMNMNGS